MTNRDRQGADTGTNRDRQKAVEPSRARKEAGSPSRVVEEADPPSRAREEAGFSSRLQLFAFYVIIALAAARPLMAEMFGNLDVSFLQDSGTGPTQASTVWMDALLLAASAVALLQPGRRCRAATLTAIGLGLLLVAVVVSTAAADNCRLAANAGASFFIGVLASVALILLMKQRWMIHVALAAMLASGAATAWKCVAWRWYEFAETQEAWRQQQAALAARGVEVDAAMAENFTRRLGAGESMGYLAHPNNAGAALATWLLPAVGLLAACVTRARRCSDPQTLAAVATASAFCAALAVGLWLTRSEGAYVAFGAGLVLFLMLVFAGRRIALRPVRVAAVLAGLYAAVVAGGAAYGVVKGTLPHASLAFRWHYWAAGARVIADAPLTGVGRENFLAGYLRHKPPESPEEVRNAHNVWVTLLAELGPVGAAAFALLAWVWLVETLRKVRHSERSEESSRDFETAPARKQDSGSARHAGLLRMTATIAATLAAHAVFARFGLSNPGVAIIWAIEIGVLWATAFALALWAIESALGDGAPIGDGAATGSPANDAAATRWLMAGVVATVPAAFVANLVGFSFFTPAGLAIVAVMAAVAMRIANPLRIGSPSTGQASVVQKTGQRPVPQSQAVPQTRLAATRSAALACGAGSALVLAHVFVVAIPTTRGEAALTRLRRALSTPVGAGAFAAAIDGVEQAVAADAWDADLPRELALAMGGVAASPGMTDAQRLAWLRDARTYSAVALERSDGDAPNWRTSARLHERVADVLRQSGQADPSDQRGRADQAVASLRAAAADWQRACELYPAHARSHVWAGQIWQRIWRETGDDPARRRAVEHFETALSLNDRLPEREVMRLPADQVRQIRTDLANLSAARRANHAPPP